MNKIKLLLCLLIVSVLSSFATPPLEPGKTIPSIALTDLNGKSINSLDLVKDGKITVLSFWATWCVPCKVELNTLSDNYTDLQKKYNAKVVAISIDDSRSSTKVKPYADAQRWDFSVLLDINQDFKRALNIQSVPFTILLDQTGKIAYTHSGYVEGDEVILEEEIGKLSK